MSAIKCALLLILLPCMKCGGVTNTETPKCTQNYTKLNNEPIIDIKEYCQNKLCLATCCKDGEMLYRNSLTPKCVKYSDIPRTFNNLSYSKFDIYNKDIKKVGNLINFIVDNRFVMVHNEKFMKKDCASSIITEDRINFYVTEDATLKTEQPNRYEVFGTKEQLTFCVELIWMSKKQEVRTGFIFLEDNLQKSSDEADEAVVKVFSKTALLVSCFFMLLVLLVYAALPQMRNIVGLVLMAYVGTLMVANLIKAIWLLDNESTCKNQIVFYYYAIISSFFWLNIMSWDVWWTIRGTRKCRPIHRQGEMMKFMWYGVYAWGVPMVITVAVYFVDQADLQHMPNIVKPFFDNCLANKNETFLYLYVPILILLFINCVLFVMTMYNFMMMSRAASCLNSSESKKNNKNQNRFGLYIKISALMGISWVIELIQLLVNHIHIALFILMNAYNLLLGVAIFFIFIFQKDILIKLCKRFNIENKWVKKLQTEQSTKTNTSLSNKPSRSFNRQTDKTELSDIVHTDNNPK